jgi:hypothetical protein
MLGETTVKEYIENWHPGLGFRDFFAWPPDAFALTSSLFNLTGCYRVALWLDGIEFDGHHQPHWLHRDWQTGINEASRQWMVQVANYLANGEEMNFAAISINRRGETLVLESVLERFEELASQTTLSHLKVLRENFKLSDLKFENQNDENQDYLEAKASYKAAIELAYCLIDLNALADTAGRGLGLPYISNEEAALAEFYGNLLLTTYGSLSTLPKHLGIVLPKMRTPQSGITPRSMSHHMTYHVTEVEVMWRTMPWPNQTENTLNILCLPLPLKFDVKSFVPSAEQFQTVRYFDYKIERKDEESKELIERITQFLRNAEKQVSRVHVLAFPEMALTEGEFKQLLEKLEDTQASKGHVPFVISGVRNELDDNGKRREKPTNEVRLAAYFAGSWYQTIQRKHHRWKLDGYQIRQYQLEGCLPTTRGWFEDIPVVQRRLTVVAPNGWLALCPLICEDLAQLEPVAPVIRGVGPTLLLALLSDGPQLKDRWSARYASILADDPGTAVLTLTSKAMAMQSKRLDVSQGDSSHSSEAAEAKNWTVGLWKDQAKGWYPINLDKEQEAFLLTIVADWKEEFTLDGRSDNFQAARFRHEGCRYDLSENVTKSSNTSTTKESRFAKWTDFRELSALIFAVDTIISLKGKSDGISDGIKDGQKDGENANVKNIKDDVAKICQWLIKPDEDLINDKCPRRKAMFVLLRNAQKSPHSTGIDVDTEERPWPTKSLEIASASLKARANLLAAISPGPCITGTWEKIFELINNRLSQLGIGELPLPLFRDGKATKHGVRYLLNMITLQNLHFRLDSAINRSNGFRPNGFSPLSQSVVKDVRAARELLKKVEKSLAHYDRKAAEHKGKSAEVRVDRMKELFSLNEEKVIGVSQEFENVEGQLEALMSKEVESSKHTKKVADIVSNSNDTILNILQLTEDQKKIFDTDKSLHLTWQSGD